MFGDGLRDFLAWASLQPHHWLDLHEALATDRYYSPLAGLYLFDERSIARGLDLLALDSPLACSELEATRPIHDGFIAALELSPAPAGNVRDAVTAFVARERMREVEPLLRDCYGNAAELKHDIRFRGLDYPAFDNGNVDIGFGVMLDRSGRRWLWSRAVFHHK